METVDLAQYEMDAKIELPPLNEIKRAITEFQEFVGEPEDDASPYLNIRLNGVSHQGILLEVTYDNFAPRLVVVSFEVYHLVIFLGYEQPPEVMVAYNNIPYSLTDDYHLMFCGPHGPYLRPSADKPSA